MKVRCLIIEERVRYDKSRGKGVMRVIEMRELRDERIKREKRIRRENEMKREERKVW